MRTSKRINWFIALLGLWQILAPFILGYAGIAAAVWNALIVGLLLIVFAAWSATTVKADTARTLDWINLILGIWLIASPFALGYSIVAAAVWNAMIVGLAVIVLSVWAPMSTHHVRTTA